MAKNLIVFLFLILIVLFQTTLVPLFSIGIIAPDIVLIFIVTIAILYGQIPATIFGFIAGILIDLLTGEFFGLTVFTKTICGFIAGYIYNENKIEYTLKNYQYLIIVGVISLINNIIYFAIYTQGTSITFFKAMFEIGLFSTIYTSVITLFPMFYFQRKRNRF